MQGQRPTLGSFPDTVDFEQGSVSNSTSMSQQTSWNNMITPIESRFSNYALSSNDADFPCMTAVSHGVRSATRWSFGEPSSSSAPQNQTIDEDIKMEHGWSSFGTHSSVSPRLQERLVEPSMILPEPSNSGPLLLPSHGLNQIPQNLNLNAGYAGNTSSDNVGTSSGTFGYLTKENDGGSGSSLGTWNSSCKRKSLEGTSGQSYPSGSSSYFPQVENAAWHTVPPRFDGASSSSSSISSPPENSPSVSPPEPINPQIGVSRRGMDEDFPALRMVRMSESSPRNFGRRLNPRHIPESPPSNLLPMGSPQSVHGFSRNGHPLSWNLASSSRASGSSGSLVLSGDRGLREEANLRSIPIHNAEHPMSIHPSEPRHSAQDPTNWSLATGNISGPTSRVGHSSSVHPLHTPTWIPHPNPMIQNPQRLTEFAPWTLFPSVEAESGGHSVHFPPMPPGPSASAQEAVMSSGHHHPVSRSGFVVERHGDDAFGLSNSWRALAADIEGRNRIISEIRHVLNAMRRGGNIRAEDYMAVDPFIYHGMGELHDRHRDMRLDVDNMSYEELLALEERIGDVSTGLSEETILKTMKQRKHLPFTPAPPSDLEPCCVCQEVYSVGDDIALLDCGHDFHTNCIKQWLMLKNLCPICKTAALLP